MKRQIALSLLLLPALAGAAVLANDTYRVPPGEWRSLRFPVTAAPARVECRFAVLAQPGAARAVLLSRQDLERFAGHQPYAYLAATGDQRRGAFKIDVGQTGTYALLLINSSASRTASPIELFVDVGPVPVAPVPSASYLSPGRKLATIALSIAGFLTLLSWSALRLLRAMQDAPRVD